MKSAVGVSRARKAKHFPLYRTLPKFVRDPLKEIQRISGAAGGDILRLDLGVARPLVVTHPDHVQHVLRENSENYVRDGVFWRPLHGLMGDSVLGEGDAWELSRRVLQPVFTARNVDALTERMAETINEAVDALDEPARSGRPVRVIEEMGHIVNKTVIRVFFGEKISADEAVHLAVAFEAVATSLAFRFLLPFVPKAIPLPGDRTFREAVQTIDETMFALVRKYRENPGDGHDIFTALCRARTAEGSELTDQWVRDNLVAMFATGTETTAVALSWLWPILATHPEVATRLGDEIDQVVGGDRVRQAHLEGLPYAKQVVQELLRLYPVGWLFPRIALRPGTIDGVPIKAGQTLMISPFLTHRLESVWERPLDFDPDRFAQDRTAQRHRYAYFPFGGGPHQCLGMHVFYAEAQLILASILSRFRPVLSTTEPFRPRIGPTLRPMHDDGGELEMILVPTRGSA
ncbi:MAG: cytochrome P450 [Actinomadura sp.]